MSEQVNLGGYWDFGGELRVARMGYGAMQLAGPGVFGPPADPDAAIAVLRRAVELGVNHIDTADYYGPHVTNDLIRTALHPYPEDLVLVTKVGGKRDDQGGWHPVTDPDEIRQNVHDNLKRLGLDFIHGVNLRFFGPDDDVVARFEALAELREQGLIQHLGVSNATADQLARAQRIAPVSFVQNLFNVADQSDGDLVDACEAQGIGYVAFFPLGGFSPIQHAVLEQVAARHGATDRQVALAWLLHRSPAVLLIPGTSTVAHLESNIAAADIPLTERDIADLNGHPRKGD
jgi:aryl-alcohol dehydrogenase-like predicted oxidoreductase